MDDPKLIINPLNRHLFPELSSDLEKNGQLQPILIDEDGFVHDGFKRLLLCGLEQLKKEIVPKESDFSNIHAMNRAQKKALIPFILKNCEKIRGKDLLVQEIARRYGISRATVYRYIEPPLVVVSNETKTKDNGRMYKDVATWNPFVGCECYCNYCKPSFQENHYFKMIHEKCGGYTPHQHQERLDLQKIPNERIVFVCGDSDVSFCEPEYFKKIIDVMNQDKKPDRVWFLQSKSPKYFEQFLLMLPKNTILLTTLETNRDTGYNAISKAPPPTIRYEEFRKLAYPRKIVTVEPLLDFDLDAFADMIISLHPEAVFIGYNSHPKQVILAEPSMEKTLDLIVALKTNGIRVLIKELRKMGYRDFIPSK